jgi:phosphoribosylformylglycinamidine synthase
MKIRAIAPTGHGINCEMETREALRLAGFDQVDLAPLNSISAGLINLAHYQMIVFPGGFLDGDDLGAAQACANRLRHSVVSGVRLLDALRGFVEAGKLVLGICNGFQLLAKLGMLPAMDGDYQLRDITVTGNDSGRFEDRWTHLSVDQDSPCVFTRGIDRMYLPVRHGEGKVIGGSPGLSAELVARNRVPVRYAGASAARPTMEYPDNPNGSEEAIAGVCDPSGRVFGLMPHPEAFLHRTNHPRWTRERLPDEGEGLLIFKNAAQYLRKA